MQLIQIHGCKRWAKISSEIVTRSGESLFIPLLFISLLISHCPPPDIQCRQRFLNMVRTGHRLLKGVDIEALQKRQKQQVQHQGL